MLKHRSLTATAATFFFLLVGVAAAHADAAGSWKLTTIGGGDPCAITLADDGAATGCPAVAKYKVRGSSLAFYAANGDVVGLLKKKGEGYEGNQMSDNQRMILSH